MKEKRPTVSFSGEVSAPRTCFEVFLRKHPWLTHTSPAHTWTSLGKELFWTLEAVRKHPKVDRAAVSIPAGAAGARVGSRRSHVNKRECFCGVHGMLEPKPGGPARFTDELGSAEPALPQLTGLAESKGCEWREKD